MKNNELILQHETKDDFKDFKNLCEEEGYLWENYNEAIFNEYHTDLDSRGRFIMDISYSEWLIYKILAARDAGDDEAYWKYGHEFYIIFED